MTSQLVKNTSYENDQSTGHFQSFFSSPPTLNLKKNPVNQLKKGSGLKTQGFFILTAKTLDRIKLMSRLIWVLLPCTATGLYPAILEKGPWPKMGKNDRLNV